jgi:hypothetical protein
MLAIILIKGCKKEISTKNIFNCYVANLYETTFFYWEEYQWIVKKCVLNPRRRSMVLLHAYHTGCLKPHEYDASIISV